MSSSLENTAMPGARTALREAAEARPLVRDPRYQAYLLLRAGFTAAPILFGLDKFLNLMLGAVTLGRLASVYDPPLRLRS